MIGLHKMLPPPPDESKKPGLDRINTRYTSYDICYRIYPLENKEDTTRRYCGRSPNQTISVLSIQNRVEPGMKFRNTNIYKTRAQ